MTEVAAQYPGFRIDDPAHVTREQQEQFLEILGRNFQKFDREVLMPFYCRIETAVRSVWKDVNIATGGNIFCCTAISTGLERLNPAGTGQIYVPHGYDSVVDTDNYDAYNTENVERLFADKRQSQKRLDLPVILGEWGAFPSKSFTGRLIAHIVGILEKYLWGSAYCEYHPGMEQDENFSALRRGYPIETAGELEKYHYNYEEKRLSVEYKVGEGETVCYCPFAVNHVESELPVSYRVKPLGEGACLCELSTKQAGVQRIIISE